MSNFESQISRMKAMMNYGLQSESKTPQYKSVEYQKKGADGKTYGIVREGTKFYIKVSDSLKDNLLKEDFNYIGGFVNRKDNEYTSYANALKNFDMKMASIKEACGNKSYVVESWDPEKNEYLMIEATDKMKKEIARQKAIMSNAANIMEGKAMCCDAEGCNCKDNIKKDKHELGDPKDGLFTQDAKPEGGDQEENNIGKPQKPVTESETLAWHETGGDAHKTMNDTYLDTSHGTEIGDSAPFTKGKNDKSELGNGVVAEDKAMHAEGENQNSPKPGVGEIGDDDPFVKPVKEAVEDDADDVESDDFDEEPVDDDTDELDDVEPVDDDTFDDEPAEGDSFEDEDAEPEATDIEDLKQEIADLKDMISTLMDKSGVPAEETAEIEFDDEPLYDDDDEEDEFEVELDDEEPEADFEEDDFEDNDDDLEDEDEDTEVFESRSYRKMRLKEDTLDYFGKHPAYQKKVMELPETGQDQNAHGRDWNDDSVYSEEPYGTQIGSSAPFEEDHDKIDNAIAESITKVLGKRNF